MFLPLLLGLAHGVADGAAGLLLGLLPRTMSFSQVALHVMLYNLLAFGCQPVAGLLTDQWRQPRRVVLIGLGLQAVALGVWVWQPTLAVLCAGLGSAFFHVGGGALALCATQGKAAGPGLFAAPGVAGLALGGTLAITNNVVIWPFWLGLGLLALGIRYLPLPTLPYQVAANDEPMFERHDFIMLALLAAIALRSAVWTLLQFIVQAQWEMVMLLAVAAMVGKVVGGLLADRVGWRRWTVGALLGAAVLLNIGAEQRWALVLGVGLLQSATPAALAATLRFFPRQPAFAAGLSLGLAIALGGLFILLDWPRGFSFPWLFTGLALVSSLLFFIAGRRWHMADGGQP